MSKVRFIFVVSCWFAPLLILAQTSVYCFDSETGIPLDFSISLDSSKTISSIQNKVILDIDSSTEIKIKSANYWEITRVLLPDNSYSFALTATSIQLKGIVVTDVHHSVNSDQTVLNVIRIDQKRIEQISAVNLKDVLSFENNIRISRDNAIGSSGLSLMGLDGNNVKLLIDGVPVVGRLFGQLDLEQFNLENIAQIEVVKGPMSVIYGSNALAGSINIITNKQSKPKASLRTYYESDGQYNITGSIVKPIKNQVFSLSGGRLFFDGWSQSNDRSFDWIPKEQYNLRFGYGLNKKKFQINYRSEFLSAFLLDRGTPLAPYGEFAIDQKYKNYRLDNSVKYHQTLKKANLNITAANNYFTRFKNKYYKDLVNVEEILIPKAAEQDTQTFNAFVFRSIYDRKIKGVESVFGLDANHEVGHGKRILGLTQQQTDIALFTSLDKKFNKLQVRLGARYAYNSSFESPLIYSVQSKYTFKKSQQIKLAYGKGFRAPSIKELYLDFNDSRHNVYGNDGLTPETSHSFTATYQKYSKYKKIGFITSIDGFYNHVLDKIELSVLGPIQATYNNIGIYETIGGTVGQTLSKGNKKLKLSFNYTGVYNGISNAQRSFNFSPQLVVQATTLSKNKLWSFNVNVNHYGKYVRVFADTATSSLSVQEVERYTMIDVNIGKKFFGKRLYAVIGAKNLLGVQNIGANISQVGEHVPSTSFLSVSPGRTVFINIRYEFIK